MFAGRSKGSSGRKQIIVHRLKPSKPEIQSQREKHLNNQVALVFKEFAGPQSPPLTARQKRLASSRKKGAKEAQKPINQRQQHKERGWGKVGEQLLNTAERKAGFAKEIEKKINGMLSALGKLTLAGKLDQRVYLLINSNALKFLHELKTQKPSVTD